MSRRPTCPTLLVLIAVLSGCAAEPIAVQPIERDSPDGPVRGYVAVVDLGDPTVGLCVTAPLAEPHPQSVEAIGKATDTWLMENGLTLAINANYYGHVAGDQLDIVGVSVSNGRVVSAPRDYEGRADPALLVAHDGSARVVGGKTYELADVRQAVAGVGGSPQADEPGTLLVRDGENTGETARVDPLKRHPRTAIGLDRSGRRLIVVVIDGRQPAWSVGVTLPELADILVEHGAYNAINLDGGGSSSFVYDPQASGSAAQQIVNHPSDGRFRPVANHLGVRRVAPTAEE